MRNECSHRGTSLLTYFSCIFCFMVFAQSTLADDNKYLKQFLDERRVEEFKDQFVFDEAGNMVSGPVRKTGDAIDYSQLLKDEVVAENFLALVRGCEEIESGCFKSLGRWKVRNVSMSITSAPSDRYYDESYRIIKTYESVLNSADIGLSPANDKIPDIAIFVGTHGEIDNFWQGFGGDDIDLDIDDKRGCFSYNEVDSNGAIIGHVSMFNKNKFYACLGDTVFSSIGLVNRNREVILSSFLSSHPKYLHPTLQDFWFIDLLYRSKIFDINLDDVNTMDDLVHLVSIVRRGAQK